MPGSSGSLRRQIVAALGLTFLLVVAVAGIAYRAASDLVSSANRTERGRQWHRRLDTLLQRLDTAEAARQTYLASRSARDLAPYRMARSGVVADLAALHGAPSLPPSQRRVLITIDSLARASAFGDVRAVVGTLQRQNDQQLNVSAMSDASVGSRAQQMLAWLLALSLGATTVATWLLLRTLAARTRLTEELRAERARLSAILTQLPTGVAVADARTRQVVFGNTHLAEIWRRPLTAPLGSSDLAAWFGAPWHDDAPHPLSRALREGVVVRGDERPLTRSDGTDSVQRVHAAPVRDEEGRIVAGVAVVEDVTTAHAAAQAATRAAQRLAQLQRLTERVSAALTADDVVRIASEDIAHAVAATSAALFVERLTDGRLELAHGWELSSHAPSHEATSRHALEAIATQAAQGEQLVVQATDDALIAALPLGAEHGVRGALTLEFRSARQLADDERTLLLAAGRIAAQGMTRARLQSLREEERRRLARELHDEFGQALTGLKLDLAWLSRQLAPSPELMESVRGMMIRVDDTVDAVRRIAAQLRPGVLDDLGLVAALEWQGNEFERRSGVPCAMDVQLDDAAIDEPYATAVFRVFQEALTNVARHAQARHVRATLAMRDGQLTLRVHDDGIGIAADRAPGLGLAGMRERAAALGGTLRVRNAADGGTEVVLTLPHAPCRPARAGCIERRMTIRIVVADDHPIVRGGLRRMVEAEPDLAIVGEADSADALFDLLARVPADVLLLDIGMPGPGIMPVLRRRAQLHPDLRTLVLSVYPEAQYGLRVLQAGGAGYLTKDQSPELLVQAIRHVHAGHRFLSPALADRLAERLESGYVTARHELLSEREFAVLLALGAGESVGAVAASLALSPKTVSTYRARVLEKLQLSTNADLVRYVRAHHLSE